ncbi:MAG: flippase [Ignavibacteria bacterium]|nr:flippase [Ignavibacteria bacterium]
MSAPAAAGIATDDGIELGALTRRIINNISALTFAQIFYRVVSLGMSILLMRHLGVVEQGLYGLVLNLVAVFGAFTDLGIANLVIRDMNQERERTAELVGSYLSLLALANIVLVAAAVSAAVLLGYETRVVFAVGLAAVGMLFGGMSSSFYAVLIGRERMKRVALIEIALTIIIALGMAAVMLAGQGLVALAGVAALAGISRLLLFGVPALAIAPGVRLRPDFPRIASMLRRGLPFTLHVGVYVIFTKIDVLLLEKMSDPATLGYYTVAARLMYPMTILSMMTATAVFPILSRHVRENPGLAFRLVRVCMRWLGAAGLLIALAVTFFAEPVIGVLLGPEYLPVAPLLRVLIWYIPIFSFYQVVSDLLVAADRVWGIVWISIACLALSIAMNVVLIPRYGAQGAAATTVFCESLRCVALITFARVSIKF